MIAPPRRLSQGERLTWAHYNALLDYVRRSTPLEGRNVSVDYTMGGAMINVATVEDEAYGRPLPWTVRYHEVGEDAVGQWEVYVPEGAMSVGDTCRVLNIEASLTEGHEADDGGWRLLCVDEDEGSPVSSGDGSYRLFDVVAHGKRRAMIADEDEDDAPERPGVYVAAHRHVGTGEDPDEDDEGLYSWGDEFSQAVATIKVTDDGVRTVTRLCSSAISVSGSKNSPFDLVWWFARLSDGDLEVHSVMCVRQHASIAGGDMQIAEQTTDVMGAGKVYLHVVTADGRNEGEVVSDPSSATADDSNTFALLYVLCNDVVSSDARTANLSNIQYYR